MLRLPGKLSMSRRTQQNHGSIVGTNASITEDDRFQVGRTHADAAVPRSETLPPSCPRSMRMSQTPRALIDESNVLVVYCWFHLFHVWSATAEARHYGFRAKYTAKSTDNCHQGPQALYGPRAQIVVVLVCFTSLGSKNTPYVGESGDPTGLRSSAFSCSRLPWCRVAGGDRRVTTAQGASAYWTRRSGWYETLSCRCRHNKRPC